MVVALGAWEALLKIKQPEGISAVSGSTYLLGALLSFWTNRAEPLERPMKALVEHVRNNCDRLCFESFLLRPILAAVLWNLIVLAALSFIGSFSLYILCSCSSINSGGDYCLSTTIGGYHLGVCPNFEKFAQDDDLELPLDSWRYLFSLTVSVALASSIPCAIFMILGIKHPTARNSDQQDSFQWHFLHYMLVFVHLIKAILKTVLLIVTVFDTSTFFVWLFFVVRNGWDIEIGQGDILNIPVVLTVITLLGVLVFSIIQLAKKAQGSTTQKILRIGISLCVPFLFTFWVAVQGYVLLTTDSNTFFLIVILVFMAVASMGVEGWCWVAGRRPNILYGNSIKSVFFKPKQKKTFPTWVKKFWKKYFFCFCKRRDANPEERDHLLVDHQWEPIFNAAAHDVFKNEYDDVTVSDPLVFTRTHSLLFHEGHKHETKGKISNWRAMSLSGAAISPNMGNAKPLSVGMKFVLALLNINLGSWVYREKSTCCEYFLSAVKPLPVIVSIAFGATSVAFVLEFFESSFDDVDVPYWIQLGAIGIFFIVFGLLLVCAFGDCLRASRLVAWFLLESPFFRRILSISNGGVDHTSPMVPVADGGHLDNLGLFYPVFEKRATKIIAIDAGLDAENTLGGLKQSMELINYHFSARKGKFEYKLRFAPELLKPDKSGFAQQNYNVIKWKYSEEQDGELHVNEGDILYLRMVMVRTLPYSIHLLRNNTPKFPHRPTHDPTYTLFEFSGYYNLGSELVTRNPLLNDFLLGVVDWEWENF